MHLVESPCREVLFTDIEIEHPTVAKHEFEIVFLNGEKLRSCYLSDNPVVFFLRLLHQDHDFIMRHVRRLIPISTHIPRVGDDAIRYPVYVRSFKFQSTSPAWGMTSGYFTSYEGGTVSIHIPRVGDDIENAAKASPATGFNPHPPRGG